MAKEEKALIEFAPKSVQDVFTQDGGLQPYLDQLAKLTDELPVVDATKEKGRKELKSFAYKLRQSKTAIDEPGKKLVAELKALPKIIDANRKHARDTIDGLIEKALIPVTEWEKKEQARIDAIQARIDKLRSFAVIEQPTVEKARNALTLVYQFPIDDSFQELEADAAAAQQEVTATLQAMVKELEREAELEELRRKDREREIERQAEERARAKVAEEQREERERLARREAELNAQAARITQQRQEAPEPEQVAAIERLQNAAPAQPQTPDRERMAAVHRAIIEDMVCMLGVDPQAAKNILTAIYRGQIRALSINYSGEEQ